jgi:chloramphenicol 3-O phosphotransferase
MSGKLIVLNGTSSSGKTSIARCLQANWPTPLLYLALDTAIGMMPFAYTGSGLLAEEGYCLRPVSVNGETVVVYSLGRHARFLNSNLVTMAEGLSAAGYDVIIDHVITDDETMADLAKRVSNRPAFLIGIICEQDIAEERERSRGDRMIGLVAGQAPTVHSGVRPYDLIVDSSHATPEQLAEAIHRFVDASSPKAFRAS